MKVAIIGSRGLSIADSGEYLPEDTAEIVSGGLAGWIPPRGNMLCGTA